MSLEFYIPAIADLKGISHSSHFFLAFNVKHSLLYTKYTKLNNVFKTIKSNDRVDHAAD